MFQNSPFKSLSSCLFRIRDEIKDEAEKILTELNSKGKWLSIHVRGYYEKGYGGYSKEHDVSYAFKCANKLLKTGMVNSVFFATENAELDQLVNQSIALDININIIYLSNASLCPSYIRLTIILYLFVLMVTCIM